MKRFKSLVIQGNPGLITELLDSLKKQKGKRFEYNRSLSEEYANNLFREVSNVGCFRTARVSLFESCVWMLFDGKNLVVTNITSSLNPILTIDEYNQVIDAFCADCIAPKMKDYDSLELLVSPGDVSMSDLISKQAFDALNEWQMEFDKVYCEETSREYSLLVKAIVALVKNSDDISYEDLEGWLVQDCNWPESTKGHIYVFYQRYELGRDVLNEWNHES